MTEKPLRDVVQGHSSQEVQFISLADLVLPNQNERNGVNSSTRSLESPGQHFLMVLFSIPFDYLARPKLVFNDRLHTMSYIISARFRSEVAKWFQKS